MNFNKQITTALLALVVLAGCKKNSAEDLFDGAPRNQSDSSVWPAFTDSNLKGQVFGQNWTAAIALVRPIQGDVDRITLEFFSEVKPDACKSLAYTETAKAWMTIPANYQAQEYKRSSTEGTNDITTITFSKIGAISKNVMADKTRLIISALTNQGFDAAVYAEGDEADGTISTINGKIPVIDCRKQVAFDVWESFEGSYQLQSFDGVATAGHHMAIEWDTRSFYDRSSASYRRTMTFPLLLSVSSGSTVTSDFGPMEGLGQTSFKVDGVTKTLTYSYHGPMTYRGVDVTLNIEMTVVQNLNRLSVTYVLEVPGHIEKKNHQFELTK